MGRNKVYFSFVKIGRYGGSLWLSCMIKCGVKRLPEGSRTAVQCLVMSLVSSFIKLCGKTGMEPQVFRWDVKARQNIGGQRELSSLKAAG